MPALTSWFMVWPETISPPVVESVSPVVVPVPVMGPDVDPVVSLDESVAVTSVVPVSPTETPEVITVVEPVSDPSVAVPDSVSVAESVPSVALPVPATLSSPQPATAKIAATKNAFARQRLGLDGSNKATASTAVGTHSPNGSVRATKNRVAGGPCWGENVDNGAPVVRDSDPEPMRTPLLTRRGSVLARSFVVVSLLVLACGGGTAEPAKVDPANRVVDEASAEDATSVEASKALARSQALEKQGDLDGALAAAESAIEAGGGRDARLQAAKLAILRREFDKASNWLKPLVSHDPEDAAAQYNLALVHHQQGNYNQARNGYLAALRRSSRHADARYNLAVLTHERGILEEAKHHVAKFRASFPEDPRGPALERMVGGKGAAGPADADAPEP